MEEWDKGVGVPCDWFCLAAASVIKGLGIPGRLGNPLDVVAVDAPDTARGWWAGIGSRGDRGSGRPPGVCSNSDVESSTNIHPFGLNILDACPLD